MCKGVTETIRNKTKEQNEGFLGTLIDALGSILQGNLSSGKGIVRADSGIKKKKKKKGKGTVRAVSRNKKGKGIVTAGYGKE